MKTPSRASLFPGRALFAFVMIAAATVFYASSNFPWTAGRAATTTPATASAPAPLDGRFITLASLNCMWFFPVDGSVATEVTDAERPRTKEEYERKAGHLAGLLPVDPPLLVGLQEIGNQGDVEAIAEAARRRYGRNYQALFVAGRDTHTGQNVGALFDPDQGFTIRGRPARSSDLDRALSKHLTLTLDNAATGASLNWCTVHLRIPANRNGARDNDDQQVQALLRWVTRFTRQPNANVVLVGDFNDIGRPGTAQERIAPLVQSELVDAIFKITQRATPTQASGAELDRILVSPSLISGSNKLKLVDAGVIPHRYADRREPLRLEYTDHFAVWAKFAVTP